MSDLPIGAYVASALAAANISCDSGEDVDRFLAELEKRGVQVSRPYVGGHPEMPLHEYRPNGRGGCLSCDEERESMEAVIARHRADCGVVWYSDTGEVPGSCTCALSLPAPDSRTPEVSE